MSNTYSLTFVNNSTNDWDFCCYQNDPDIGNPNVMSLAWYAFPVDKTTSVTFSWTIDYQLVWSQTGTLSPGVRFSAGQHWDATLGGGNNSAGFTQSPDGAFTFDNAAPYGDPGTLYIKQDNTIPLSTAAVGINMAIAGAPQGTGSGTYAVAAEPNITAAFTPHPNYWVTFGSYTPGQVLDVGQVTNAQQVEFPDNVYDMVATLDQNNNWTVAPATGHAHKTLHHHEKLRA